MTMSPQLANTLEHIVGQLDILTQVHMTLAWGSEKLESVHLSRKYCGTSIASFPGHTFPIPIPESWMRACELVVFIFQ